jgi:hypothetical protein
MTRNRRFALPSLLLLLVSPPAAAQALTSLGLESPAAYGGDSVAGVVGILRVTAQGEMSVTLESSHPGVATVPAGVAVSRGGLGVFQVATRTVTEPTLVTISASRGGFTLRTTLRVLPTERLTFEDLPAETVVTDQYAHRGVSFAANAEPPSIVETDEAAERSVGGELKPQRTPRALFCGGAPLLADFLEPVSWVRLQVRITGRVWGSDFWAWLRIYDDDGRLLAIRGQAFIGSSNGPLVPVEIDAGAPVIRRLELRIISKRMLTTENEVSEENAFVVKVVDNLQFSPHSRGDRRFLRGDANDDAAADLSDAVFILGFLFAGGEEPACLKSADVDDSGALDISDAIGLLGYRFQSGPLPAAPFPACGSDRTLDELSCAGPTACRS